MRLKFTIYCIIVFSIVTSLLTVACKSNNPDNINCAACNYQKPDSVNLTIKVTINNENPYVPIMVFKGEFKYNYSNSDVEYIDTVTEGTNYLSVPVNQYYSVRAEYKDGSNKIYAVDGDNLTLTEVTDVCVNTCWIANGGNIDVRLKK